MDDLPQDVLAVVFNCLKARGLAGSEGRSNLMMVCRAWRNVLQFPEFRQALSITIGASTPSAASRALIQLPAALQNRKDLHELQIDGHLRETLIQEKMCNVLRTALGNGPFRNLRKLRLVDIGHSIETLQLFVNLARSGSCNAAYLLEELYVRPASHTYSASRVVTRIDHVTSAILLQILTVFPKLRVLDVASPGSSPWLSSPLGDALSLAPDLQEFTLFGRLRVGDLEALKKAHHLTRLTIMGDWIYKELPHLLPVLNETVTCLVLEDYPITDCNARQVLLLTDALPALRRLEISILRRSRLAPFLFNIPRSNGGHVERNPPESPVFDLLESMEAEQFCDLQQLQTYLSQPALGTAAIAVGISEATIRVDRLRSRDSLVI